MNAASVLVLVSVVAGAALVVWRNLRKGAPCSCGDCCGCHCHGARAGGPRFCSAAAERAGGPRSCAAAERDVHEDATSHAK